MGEYIEIIKKIETLKRVAEKKRVKEVAVIVRQIKAQIKQYNLTASELGLSAKSEQRRAKAESDTAARAKATKSVNKVAVRYRDSSGNTWTGRGKRPLWLVAALAKGDSLDSYRVTPVTSSS